MSNKTRMVYTIVDQVLECNGSDSYTTAGSLIVNRLQGLDLGCRLLLPSCVSALFGCVCVCVCVDTMDKAVKDEKASRAKALKPAAPRKKVAKREKKPVSKAFQVDFNQLSIASLKRYKKHFKLQAEKEKTGATKQTQSRQPNKPELVQLVNKHFKEFQVNRGEQIPIFCYIVKHGGNKIDMMRKGKDGP